jgi:hypothetical protein
MSNVNGKLTPRRRRSKLGPTRYQPRCKARGCVNPLETGVVGPFRSSTETGKHVGLCVRCRAETALQLLVDEAQELGIYNA